jgi:isopentenyl phosphate kinase
MPGDPTTGPVVVKLGGSVITRKREVERIRPKILERLTRELVEGSNGPLVVLHGAGSFGHPGARRFGLSRAPEGRADSPARARGAAIVAAEVRRLHVAVLRALVAAGGAPASVPMATHARNRAGELAVLDAGPFRDALGRGLLPVSFGDVIPDDDWGSSILSADTIALGLARDLRPSRVVFVSDVPGILERPATSRRRVAEEVTEEVIARLRPATGATDVTGGIRAKANVMRAIARAGVDACLISGLTDGALRRAVRGDFVYGSWAHAGRG